METDALSRRLRFAEPKPTAKLIALQPADLELFRAIHRHGPLPSNYLYEFTKHLRKSFIGLQWRLTDFYHGDLAGGPYLVRPPQQFSSFYARYQHLVYDLAPRAKQALGIDSAKRKDPFLHQLMSACAAASIELTAQKADLRYIPREQVLDPAKLRDAKDAKNPMAVPLHGFNERSTLIPDDLFGIAYPGEGYRFFAVEIDRNTESIERTNLEQTAFARKVAGYLQILRENVYRTWWGIPNLHVLTITTNETHARNLLDYIAKQAEPKLAERFLVTSDLTFGPNWRVPRTVLSHLLESPWQTTTGTKDISHP